MSEVRTKNVLCLRKMQKLRTYRKTSHKYIISKRKIKSEERPTKDALINLQAIAYEVKEFVHFIATFPDLIAIIGMEEMLYELKDSLQTNNKYEQLLSYGTRFSMGDFYVPAFLSKHQAFEEKPVLPDLFMLHERKFQTHHELVFDTLKQYCKG